MFYLYEKCSLVCFVFFLSLDFEHLAQFKLVSVFITNILFFFFFIRFGVYKRRYCYALLILMKIVNVSRSTKMKTGRFIVHYRIILICEFVFIFIESIPLFPFFFDLIWLECKFVGFPIETIFNRNVIKSMRILSKWQISMLTWIY